MASLHKVRGKWYVFYRVSGLQKCLSTKQIGRTPNAVARSILDKYIQMEGAAKHGVPWVDSSQPVSALIDMYWQSAPSMALCTHTKKGALLNRLRKFMGKQSANSVTVIDAERFMNLGLNPSLGDSTKDTYKNFIASLWAWGITRKLVCENPWKQLQYRRTPKVPRRCLTQEEIVALLTGTKGYVLLAICLGFYQGARVGDCIALYAEDIDFSNRLITFRRRKGSRVNAPKSQTMPLHPKLQEILGAIPLVSGKRVIPLTPSDLGNRVSNAMRKAGVNATHHYLRHTFITSIINRRQGLAQASELAGHSSWNITRKYTHLAVEELRPAIEAHNNNSITRPVPTDDLQ